MLRQLGWDIVDLWWSDLDRMDAVLADVLLALDKVRRLQSAPGLPSGDHAAVRPS